MRTTFAVLALGATLTATTAFAAELRYVPVNPSFGGNAFNGSTLLSVASAQNQHQKPADTTDPVQAALKSRESSLLYGAVTESQSYLYAKILPSNLQPRTVPLSEGRTLVIIPDADNNILRQYIYYPDGTQTFIGISNPRS